jgi:low temperature requirement protein LtrA
VDEVEPATVPEPLEQERRTSPVELLWDLVFVFAITQVTTLLWRELTWKGFGRAMLVLALVWWAWSAFVWAANAQVADSPTLRAALLVSSIAIFIAGLSIPHAFGSEATLFAVSYAVVRFLHLGLYADASKRGNASWTAIAGFAVTVVIGMALLIAGSFASGAARTGLWVLAAAIDYAGPAWLTRERLRGLQQVAVAHFAERYSLFVIICLGESIVAIGVGAHG